VERIPCSSAGHAPDLVATIAGTGSGRVVLVGHVDTVIAHEQHKPLTRDGDRLLGSGTVDMKGGVVLALGVMRALAERPAGFGEVALLLVCDEEWRTSPFMHVDRFAGWDACLCFEAGEQTPDGDEGVVVRRKAAGTVRVDAEGVASHSGASPDRGRNALLALAVAAQAVAAHHDPHGADHLTAVPTVLRAGQAFNVVPGSGELICDVRADDAAPILRVLESIPEDIGGVTLRAELMRLWPGMHSEAAVWPALGAATEALGRRIVGVPRGGASDASHLAAGIPVTIDGLGPRGGMAHNPGEFVLRPSLRSRAEVALALAQAVLVRV
jgi:glutamate carboxypeptidase